MTEALHLTPHGMSLAVYPFSFAFFGASLWGCLRDSDLPWFRWLTPIGVLTAIVGFFLINLWVIEPGIITACVGLGLKRHWKEERGIPY